MRWIIGLSLFFLSFTVNGQSEEGFEELPPVEQEPLPEPPVLESQPAATPQRDPSPQAAEELPPDPFADTPKDSINEVAPADVAKPSTPAPTPNSPPAPAQSPTRPQFQDPFAQESAPIAPVPAPAQPPAMQEPPRAKPFAFPDPKDRSQGPITQDIVRSEQVREVTGEGTWSLGFSGGGAFNVNRRLNQPEFNFYIDYRIETQWEIGFFTYCRFSGDTLVGMLATGKYYWRVTNPESFRIEIAPILGMGWTLRGEDQSLNEGRFPVRYGADTLFYANPRFAVVGQVHFESFLFGRDTRGKWKNYFKGGGPLTQVIANLGVRFQF